MTRQDLFVPWQESSAWIWRGQLIKLLTKFRETIGKFSPMELPPPLGHALVISLSVALREGIKLLDRSTASLWLSWMGLLALGATLRRSGVGSEAGLGVVKR